MRILFTEIELPYSIELCNGLNQNDFDISSVVTFYGEHAKHALSNNKTFKNTSAINAHHLFSSEELTKHYSHYFSLLSPELTTFFETIERDFYILTDRQNHKSVSFRERKLFFRNLMRFWHGYLTQEKTDIVYFTYTPHVAWQLMLMHMCQYLEIKYCYLSHTAINNRSILKTRYDQIDKVPADYLSASKKEDIINGIPKDLWEDFSSDSIVTNIVKAQNDAFNKQLGVNTEKRYFAYAEDHKNLISSIIRFLKSTFNIARNKKRFRLAMSLDRKKSELRWFLNAYKHKIFAQNLKKQYESHTSKINYEKPYIYFPMHLQPELTSQPEAMIFEDHLLALETILEALPEGWLVYVKENPRQFDTNLNRVSAMNFRNNYDYLAMLNHKNVRLVPQSEQSEKLVEHAKFVITLTGTAGWEALNSGKACGVFGYPWYSPCNSCFTLQNSKDIAKAIVKAQSLSKEDVELDLIKYISYFQDKLFIGSLSSPSDISYNTKSYNELLENHIVAIKSFFITNTK